ncbi:MAG: ABC transporter permease [Acidimicrobiales bacterium]
MSTTVTDDGEGGGGAAAAAAPEPTKTRRRELTWIWADGSPSAVILIYCLAAVIYLITGIRSPGFFTGGKLLSVFVLASVLGVLALAQQLVLILKGVDLSLPWTMNMGAVLIAYFPHRGFGESVESLCLTLLCGLAVGLVNGFGIVVVGISPIIMTLGMNGLVQGTLEVLTNGQGFIAAPSWVVTLGSGSTISVPNILIAWGVIAVVAVVVLGKTTAGARLLAVGSSDNVARYSGLRIRRVTFAAYAIDGLLAAFAGILLCGFVSESYLGMGDPYLFLSVAAAVVGGVSIYGGQGSYIGVIGGALTLTLLTYLFAAFNLGVAASDVAFGVMVGLVVAIAGLRRRAGASRSKVSLARLRRPPNLLGRGHESE